MGGFLLIKKYDKTPLAEVEKLYRSSIDVFKKKGLELNKKIDNEYFSVFLFHKYSIKLENIVEYKNKDFIISIGTTIYNGQTGTSALKKLFEDFSNGESFYSNLCGNYAIIIFYKGNLYVFNDYLGVYRIFFNKSKSIFSNSFLAVSKALKEKNISRQELYEYTFDGAFYGDKTIYKEVELLCSKHLYQILPEIKRNPKNISYSNFQNPKSFNELVEITANSLIEYFDIIKNNFGDQITSALSGGYDSRLMLALAKKVGISPNLYVYGGDNSKDVAIAKTIAKGENFEIDHINRNEYPKIEKNDFYEIVKKNFYLFDGLGNRGVFDNGSDIDTRIKRTKKSLLQLNGGGGEIYRNFWKLPDKSLSIRSFLRSKYGFVDYSICTNKFNRIIYFSNFKEKIKKILSIDGFRITRKQAEMLYPFLRLKYWMGINNSINNQFAYAITPYAEPKIVFQSINIPMKYKNLGIFQAALIREIDANLSKYPSCYGFDFYHKIKAKRKLTGFGKRNIPIFIKSFIRRKFRSPKYNQPYYLQKEYLKELINYEELGISKYLNVRQIKNPEMLSRVFSIELLLQDKL